MADPDSVKATQIAAHAGFQARLHYMILKETSYAVSAGLPTAAAMEAAARTVANAPNGLENVCLLTLSDPGLLVKADPSTGGQEITDADLQAKVQAELVNWGNLLAP